MNAYRTGLHSFSEFRQSHKLPECWPPTIEHVMLFVSFLSASSFSANTAGLYIAAVSFQNKVQGLTDTTKHFLVSKMLEGFRRVSKNKRTRRPITLPVLEGILAKVSAVCRDEYEAALFKAAYTLAFFGFMRVGEITTPKKGTADSSKVLGIGDIRLVNQNKALVVTIRYSKTDQYGAGETIKIMSTHSGDCPVLAMNRFLDFRPQVYGPLFCHVNGEPLTRFQFASMLQNTLRLFDPSLKGYKCHSFRLGAATRAAQLGLSAKKIKESGRWSSDAYKSYICGKQGIREVAQLQ